MELYKRFVETMRFDDIDWDAVWNETVPNSATMKYRREKDPVKFWNARAAQFNADAMRERADDVDEILRVAPVTKDTTILDVGAGTGRFTIPLAKVAHQVTAVDASIEMLKFLEKNAAAEGVSKKIRLLNRKWEDLAINQDIVPHDIVIAPYVLGHLDFARAIPLIIEAAKEWVFFFTWVTRFPEKYQQLYQAIHGEPYRMPPEHLILLGKLNEVGIHANLKISPRMWWGIYATADAAFTDYKRRINPPDDSFDTLIRQFVTENSTREAGGVKFPEAGISAMIWWQKGA